MKPIVHWEAAFAALDGKADFSLLIHDWDTGLQCQAYLSEPEAKACLQEAWKLYGERFSWRAFNQEFDMWWHGEGGVLCEGAPKKVQTISLETDYRRFPGASAFWEAEHADVRYTHAVVEPVEKAGRVV